MKEITIKIRPKHFHNATQYIDNQNCPLAIAVKEHFKVDNVMITSCFAKVGLENRLVVFKLKQGWWPGGTEQGSLGYNKHGAYLCVDDLIRLARQKKKVGTYEVKLIPQP